MRPKDLKSPFSWKERRPLIADRIVYVPSYYQEHHAFTFPKWESLFERAAPLDIEYCSGNGEWIVDRAKRHPERNWVAVEIQFDRVRKIWSKLKNEKLTNLIIVCGDARLFNAHYAHPHSFDSIYINFPDPWPKEKHEKKRLLNAAFFSQLSALSRPHASLTIVTDHAGYAASAICALKNSNWQPVYPEPHYQLLQEGYGTSYFDTLFRQQGLTIHQLLYTRSVSCALSF